MKPRTKWTLATAAVLVFLALCIFAPGVGLAVLTGAGAVWAFVRRGVKAVGALIRGERGIVEGGGDTFTPVSGKPDQIDVWAAAEDPAAARRVDLSGLGITAAQVRAVRIVPGGAAVVEVLP
jgi:hypothetical protein